jgi:chromosome segregation ATPase
MESSDLTIEILKGIRDEVRTTNVRLDTLRVDLTARIDETNARLDTTNTRLGGLERRVTETEVRLATELVAVAGAVRELRDTFREDRAVRDRVADHEQRIAAIERRAG